MSKVFVAGGSGRVAAELIKNLVADGHKVIAGSRHPESIIKLDGVTPINLDLHASVEEIANLMKDTSIVYFVAGSRGKDVLQTDAFGAVKTMQAAEKNGIKRFVLLSSFFALQPEKWNEYELLQSITDYNIAKFFADNYLIHNTHLDYTILQPAGLTETPGIGKVTFENYGETKNPIPDVAKVLADIPKHKNTIGKVIIMTSGDIPINDALSKV